MENAKPYMIERIVAALSYLTMGMAGFIWLILGLLTKARLRPFMQYHIFQSIFISIALILIQMLLGILINIISIVPFVNTLVLNIVMLLNMPLLFNLSIIQMLVSLLIAYLGITAFCGFYSYIPYISEIISQNTRR